MINNCDIPFGGILSPDTKLTELVYLTRGKITIKNCEMIRDDFQINITTREYNIIKKMVETNINKYLDASTIITRSYFQSLSRGLVTYLYTDPIKGSKKLRLILTESNSHNINPIRSLKTFIENHDLSEEYRSSNSPLIDYP